VETYSGKDLEGKKYVPLFEYFGEMRERKCFTVITAKFVSDKDGTGIVHCAPGFGEDDYASCLQAKLIEDGKAPCPVDSDGKFLPVVSDYAG
jgi:isoleucyl-tRNA synthetase